VSEIALIVNVYHDVVSAVSHRDVLGKCGEGMFMVVAKRSAGSCVYG